MSSRSRLVVDVIVVVFGVAALALLSASIAHPWYQQYNPNLSVDYWPLQVRICATYLTASGCTGTVRWQDAESLGESGLDYKIHQLVQAVIINSSVCTDPVMLINCISNIAEASFSYTPLSGYRLSHTMARVAGIMGLTVIYPVAAVGLLILLCYHVLREYGRLEHPKGQAKPPKLMETLAAILLLMGLAASSLVAILGWQGADIRVRPGSLEGGIGSIFYVLTIGLLLVEWRLF